MPHLTVSACAPAVVEARPLNNSVVIKIGDSLVSLAPDEVAQLCQDLSRACLEVRRVLSPRRVGMLTLPEPALQKGNADLVEAAA